MNDIITLEEYNSNNIKYNRYTKIIFNCKCCNKTVKKQIRSFKNVLLCTKCLTKQTNLKRYGVEYPAQNKDIHEKQIKTFKKHYNDINFKNNLIAKRKNTLLKKYNNENYNNVEKREITKLLKYNNKNYNNREKFIKTTIEKYNGVGFGSEIIKNKIKQTNIINHNNSEYRNTDKMIETAIKNGGIGTSRKTILEKIKNTMLEKYGKDHNWKIPEFRKNNYNKKYFYDNVYFDSSWELAYYIWLKDHNIDFEYHPKIYLKYDFNGKEHYYEPDFKVNNELIEIKGPHFFNEKGEFINPYNKNLNELYKVKYQCMLKNNVKIIVDISKVINYINLKYGDNYMKLFKKENTRV